jgi:hypothetical protein
MEDEKSSLGFKLRADVEIVLCQGSLELFIYIQYISSRLPM